LFIPFSVRLFVGVFCLLLLNAIGFASRPRMEDEFPFLVALGFSTPAMWPIKSLLFLFCLLLSSSHFFFLDMTTHALPILCLLSIAHDLPLTISS